MSLPSNYQELSHSISNNHPKIIQATIQNNPTAIGIKSKLIIMKIPQLYTTNKYE